ncbi:hypothetical protein T4D_16335, partial [Trichinella pseudospiralis]
LFVVGIVKIGRSKFACNLKNWQNDVGQDRCSFLFFFIFCSNLEKAIVEVKVEECKNLQLRILNLSKKKTIALLRVVSVLLMDNNDACECTF